MGWLMMWVVNLDEVAMRREIGRDGVGGRVGGKGRQGGNNKRGREMDWVAKCVATLG
jgi:hypothetical protein